jgi:hypothetical protein
MRLSEPGQPGSLFRERHTRKVVKLIVCIAVTKRQFPAYNQVSTFGDETAK